MKIIYIAAVGAFYNVLRVLTFLPIYGAKCLEYKKTTFYPAILKNTASVILLALIAFGISMVFSINSWIKMIIACVVVGILGIAINVLILFNKEERNESLVTIKNYISKFRNKERG